MEIERKFLVAGDVPSASAEPVEIEQGYLAVARDGGAEVRLRRKGDATVLTVKRGEGRTRAEEEVPIDEEGFAALWPMTEGRRLEKTRFVIADDGLEIELDVFGGELEGLQIAEVEFPDERTADAFEPPDWFGAEVTGKPDYLNESLATDGAPR